MKHSTGYSVLHVHIAEGFGGAQTYTVELIRELLERGVKVFLVGKSGSDLLNRLPLNQRFVIPVAGLFASMFKLFAILRVINEQQIRVIHCHMSSDLRLAVLLKIFAPQIRLIYHSHVGVGRPKQDVLHRFVYAKVSRVIAISSFVALSLLGKTPIREKTISVIPYGIDTNRFSPVSNEEERRALRRSLGIPEEALVLCLPSRLSAGKGHITLVKALQLAALAGPWLLLFPGSRDFSTPESKRYNDSLDSVLREDQAIAEKIKFLGHVDNVQDILRLSDIVCIPSSNEAFGLVVVEAMACGIATLGASSGAIPEIIGAEAGLLADPHDPRDWAEAITKLSKSQELRRHLGEEARREVLRKYNISGHVDRVSVEYAALIDS
jgi:glycosyltransferase involved in cell wall biosynthesis